MKRAACIVVFFAGAWSPVGAQNNRIPAQPDTPATAVSDSARITATAVPNIVRFSGTLPVPAGSAPETIGVVFSLYESAEGGTALWSETQNVQPDADGHYTALLGATGNAGLPLALFSNGKARWLGVQKLAPGEVEQQRVLLTGVPYAIKATDTEMLGGLPASAYALAASLPSVSSPAANSTLETAGAADSSPQPSVSMTVTTPGGTTNTVPLFASASSIVNSTITEIGNKVGINTAKPRASLHNNGDFITKGPWVDVRAFGATGVASPCTGTKDNVETTAIKNAIASVSTSGGTVLFPAGTYNICSTLSLDALHGVQLVGIGGVVETGSTTATSTLFYTAASGSLMTLHSALGVEISHLGLSASSTAYAGTLIDLAQKCSSCGATGSIYIHDCNIGPDVTSSAILISIPSSTNIYIERNNFTYGSVAIQGTTASDGSNPVGFANVVVISGNTFQAGFSKIAILAGGQDWTIEQNSFEPYLNVAGAFDTTPCISPGCTSVAGLSYTANWHGDASTGTWFNTNGGSVAGGVISGNAFLTGDVGVDLKQGNSWLTITGNDFENNKIGINLYSGASHVNAFSNIIQAPIHVNYSASSTPVDLNSNLIAGDGVRPILIGDNAFNASGANAGSGVISIQGEEAPWTDGRFGKGSGGSLFGGFGFQGNSDTLSYYFVGDSATSPGIAVITGANPKVGIGETSPNNTLEVAAGGTTLADAWTVRSSRRFKTNIQPLADALEKVQQLQGVSYDRKADGKHEIGVVAEDVGRVLPEVVSRDPNTQEVQGVDYSRLAALLIEAVKTQQVEIQDLKSRIERLTANPGQTLGN